MQTLHLNNLAKLLHPERDRRSASERLMENLASSNYGLQKSTTAQNASPSSGLDRFEITQNISELLSPACGMTAEEKESYLAKIMAKLKSGKKLTAEEMRFLQAEDPVLYQQAARVQAMRDSLMTRLKQCRSRQEANAVYTDALSTVSKKDPMKEYIIAAYDDAFKEFKNSGDFQNLPEQEDEDGHKK